MATWALVGMAGFAGFIVGFLTHRHLHRRIRAKLPVTMHNMV